MKEFLASFMLVSTIFFLCISMLPAFFFFLGERKKSHCLCLPWSTPAGSWVEGAVPWIEPGHSDAGDMALPTGVLTLPILSPSTSLRKVNSSCSAAFNFFQYFIVKIFLSPQNNEDISEQMFPPLNWFYLFCEPKSLGIHQSIFFGDVLE